MELKISPEKIGDIFIFEKRWDDVVKLISPLDLVLFAGSDLISKTIRKLESIDMVSHVGILVCSSIFPHLPQLEPNEWYVWESTSSLRLPGFENEVLDIFGKEKLGVQIRKLKDVFQIYKGKVYVGKLIHNPLLNQTNQFLQQIDEMNHELRELSFMIHESKVSKEEHELLETELKSIREQMFLLESQLVFPLDVIHDEKSLICTNHDSKKIIQDLRCLYEIYGNRMYNASAIDLLSAVYPALRPLRSLKYKALKKLAKLFRSKKMTQYSLFCSQFVALVYQKLGIVCQEIDAKNFVPVDFLGVDDDGQPNILSMIFEIKKSSF